mgnify:CR=1 FL=1
MDALPHCVLLCGADQLYLSGTVASLGSNLVWIAAVVCRGRIYLADPLAVSLPVCVCSCCQPDETACSEKGGGVSHGIVSARTAAVGLAAVATVPVEFALVLRAGNNGFGWCVVAVDRDAVSYIGSVISGWVAVAAAGLFGCTGLASAVSGKPLLEFDV